MQLIVCSILTYWVLKLSSEIYMYINYIILINIYIIMCNAQAIFFKYSLIQFFFLFKYSLIKKNFYIVFFLILYYFSFLHLLL